MATEDKLWLPPLSPKDQKKLDQLQKNGRRLLPKWTGFTGKTLWDWLQLLGILAIPLVVAGATLLLGIQQANLAQQQHDSDQKIAQQQHGADQQSALDQQQATILQTYIDNIQDLLLNHNLLKSSPFNPSNPYYDVSTLARARTLTALQGLDPHRKGLLLNFLHEAHLIGYIDSITNKLIFPIINLDGADLSHVDLHGVYFQGAYLSNTDLRFADLSHANLDHAFLISANLTGANLTGAYPISANLSFANLTDASLSNASLNRTYLNGANLSHADLHFADLEYSDLEGASLNYADLRWAYLLETNLSYARLSYANLTGARLFGANLKGAIGITDEELEKEAKYLQGTTMPSGSIHP